MTAIKVPSFGRAVAQIEYMDDWDFAESEDGDCMRFDKGDFSIWIRKGSEVIIEGIIPKHMTQRILKEIEGAEIYE